MSIVGKYCKELKTVQTTRRSLSEVLILSKIAYFKQFSLDPFSVDWNNEIGFTPVFLYNNAMTI